MGTLTRKFIAELLPFWLSRKTRQPTATDAGSKRSPVGKTAPLRPRPMAPYRPKPEPTDRRSSHLL